MSFWTARGRSYNQLYSTKVWYRHAIAYVLACQRFRTSAFLRASKAKPPQLYALPITSSPIFAQHHSFPHINVSPPITSLTTPSSQHLLHANVNTCSSKRQHTTTPPTLTPPSITPAGMGCRRRPGPAGSPGRILVRIPGVGVQIGRAHV